MLTVAAKVLGLEIPTLSSYVDLLAVLERRVLT